MIPAAELARRLADQAEAVCRHYLFNGHREGRYWCVGDVRNTPGRSMFVRLDRGECERDTPGRWMDAATGEYGDLLDIIAKARGLTRFTDIAAEALRFLDGSHAQPERVSRQSDAGQRASGTPDAARRLFALAHPLAGTLAEKYLHGRGITNLHGTASLRFHPRCYYRPDAHSPTETWPAMIACVTDLAGHQTGAHRTWLDPFGHGKAPIDTPRRAMGKLLGHAVRFGWSGEVLAVGEGIETMLSLRCALPHMSMAAALSSAHLAALLFPATLCRLYIAQDADPAGDAARDTLLARAAAAGIEAIVLSPALEDFNEDLRRAGIEALAAGLRRQLIAQDVARFLSPPPLPGR
ncbi:DUF7146 domain-containing protein [Phyllobacterium sp. 22229]|uniref:DUF7146 domain-containing protein n=1 Tax=Phyllobacterium sp. 22229 TaxID=3453895 RepID=UPI003F85A9BF